MHRDFPRRLGAGLLAFMLVFPSFAAHAQFSAFEDPPSAASATAAAGAQEFGPAKAEIEGGDIPQGQTNQVVVLLRNNSSGPITTQKIDLVPSSNVTAAISANQCSAAPVRPGIECAVTISIKAESGGKYRVGLLVNHTGNSKISSISITGNVAAAGAVTGGMPANEIEAFPNALDFETAKGRTPLVRSISLRNSSTRSISVSDIELAASPLTGFSVEADNCKDLEPSQSCVATVTWTPTVEGKAEGVLVLRHTGPSGSLQIPLSGEFQGSKTEKAERFPAAVSGQGLIIADRDSVDFGGGVDGAASITVSLVNMGDKLVTLSAVKLAGSDNGLSLSGDGCAAGKTLEPNAGCALTVNWVARRKGPVIDDIQIIHDGARGVLVLPVRGTATEASTMTMPVFSNVALPKLDGKALDETMVKETKRPGREAGIGGDAAALNGYRVSSLSADSAVIAGPRGRIIVANGVTQIIAGGQWTPRITPTGVELHSQKDAVFLLFDPSLTMAQDNAPALTRTATVSSAALATGGGVTTP